MSTGKSRQKLNCFVVCYHFAVHKVQFVAQLEKRDRGDAQHPRRIHQNEMLDFVGFWQVSSQQCCTCRRLSQRGQVQDHNYMLVAGRLNLVNNSFAYQQLEYLLVH